MQSFHDVKSAGDIWHFLAGNQSSFFERVRSTAANYGAGSQTGFDKLLSAGFTGASVSGSTGSSVSSDFNLPQPVSGDYKLSFYANLQVLDGAGGNIAFRQELPDPVSKVCWENYLAISPAEAKEQGWISGSLVKVTVNNQTLTLPIYIQPGIKRKECLYRSRLRS